MTSYSATATTVASTIRTKWETDLLKIAEGRLGISKFATNKVMGRGEGGTLRLSRFLRPAKVTSATSMGQLTTYEDAKAFTTNYIDLTPQKWGESFAIDDQVTLESFLSDDQYKEMVANHMARSLEYQASKLIAGNVLRHRIDADGTYQVSGTVDSGSTTTIVDDALTQNDDHWNGGRVCIYNPEGPGYDQAALVSDFAASSDTVTHGGFTTTPTTSSNYRMTVGTGLAATDVLTTSGLLIVAAMHRKLETEKYPGSLLRGVLDAEQEADIWSDTEFKQTAIYDDSGRFKNYRLIRWLDMEFMIGSETYREDADGTENQKAGVVHIAPIFGERSFSLVRWGMGQGDFGVKFIFVNAPDSMNLRGGEHGAKWVSWDSYWAGGVLRATSIIGLMTGATSINLNM